MPELNHIPEQLKDPNFRFIKLGRKGTSSGKVPIEKGWLHNNNYTYNSLHIIKHLKNNNVGVLGGKGNLLVLDFDHRIYQEIMTQELPDTFTVQSGGKGLYHLYYYIDKPFRKYPIKKRILGLNGLSEEKTMVDLVCEGAYVVIPYSQHESGKYYRVIKDIPIKNITRDTLHKVFGNDFKVLKKHLPPLVNKNNTELDYIKKNIKISAILNYFGVKEKQNRISCLSHPTSPGNLYNFEYDDVKNVWYCFDKGEGGSNIDLIMHITGCDFHKAVEILKAKFLK